MQVVTVCAREADLGEFLLSDAQAQACHVIRAAHGRG